MHLPQSMLHLYLHLTTSIFIEVLLHTIGYFTRKHLICGTLWSDVSSNQSYVTLSSILETKETASCPQKPLDEVVVDDILPNSESNEPLKHIWNDQQDRYLLQILDIGLNKVPSSFYKLRSEPMEKVDQFLSQEKANITMKKAKIQNYYISVPIIKHDFPKQI